MDKIKQKEKKMSDPIFPIIETFESIQEFIDDPDDTKKLLHLEAMLHELHDNVKREILKRGNK